MLVQAFRNSPNKYWISKNSALNLINRKTTDIFAITTSIKNEKFKIWAHSIDPLQTKHIFPKANFTAKGVLSIKYAKTGSWNYIWRYNFQNSSKQSFFLWYSPQLHFWEGLKC